VSLPCGETICGKHESLFRSKFSSKCKLCNEQHKLAENQHFAANKIAETLLESKITKLDFGKDHKKAFDGLNELNELRDHYDEIKSDPEAFTRCKFQEMRRKVSLTRDEIIKMIIECSDKIIADIDLYEVECQLNIANPEFSLKEHFDLSAIKSDLADWEVKLNKLYYDKDLCEKINQKKDEYSNRLEESINGLQDQIFLGDQKKHDFEAKYSNIVNTFHKYLGFNK
jgi:hypothetical protein